MVLRIREEATVTDCADAPDYIDANDPPAAAPDRLAVVRRYVEEVRDLCAQVEQWDEFSKRANSRINEIKYQLLPELLNEVRLPGLRLAAEGNYPAVAVEIKPFYKANIAADWGEERRERGFETLRRYGAGDLIRNTVAVTFGKEEDDLAATLKDFLRDEGFMERTTIGQSVPWSTLTAWVREQTQSRQKRKLAPIPAADLEAIGATVGQVANVKIEGR
jgi:hypothetical protein